MLALIIILRNISKCKFDISVFEIFLLEKEFCYFLYEIKYTS